MTQRYYIVFYSRFLGGTHGIQLLEEGVAEVLKFRGIGEATELEDILLAAGLASGLPPSKRKRAPSVRSPNSEP